MRNSLSDWGYLMCSTMLVLLGLNQMGGFPPFSRSLSTTFLYLNTHAPRWPQCFLPPNHYPLHASSNPVPAYPTIVHLSPSALTPSCHATTHMPVSSPAQSTSIHVLAAHPIPHDARVPEAVTPATCTSDLFWLGIVRPPRR
ncbi:hypothetical protein BU16DRAFT_289992 [Lophium mytilinum]|uniref:Uncharacterized protein n=1 Tax=Lophium mytilinum TaxID=390894 RepID=A0A6A6R1R8_9PEZI|nr:hypothetical protein BU16DRAFT_289992 [Lophium mytilinum]